MTIRNILVPMFPGVASDRQLAAALVIARTVEGHINTVLIAPDPVAAMAVMPDMSMAVGLALEAAEADSAASATESKAAFDAWRAENAVSPCMVDASLHTPFACWSRRTGPLVPTLARCARLSDLVVLNRPDAAHPATGHAFDAVAFESGRPALLISGKLPSDPLRHVLIAWNGSREATRAVAAAMTMLHAAEAVSIFTTLTGDELNPDLDLAEFLTWHGITARYVRPAPGEQAIGEALLRVARDRDATMIVMGAYTHSRVQEFLLGGVTRHVLAHADIPVLMMH